MKHELISDPVMNAIVFEGRNKSYGAFALRDHYEKNMARAMIAGMLFFILTISSPFVFRFFNSKSTTGVEVVYSPVINLDDFIRKTPITPNPITRLPKSSPMKPNFKSFSPAVLDDDKFPEEDPPSTITDPLPGTTDITDPGLEPGDEEPGLSSGDPEIHNPEDPQPKEPDIYNDYGVQQKPEFPDGMAAMYKFLGKNLQYTSLAKEIGLSGTVVVQFVVAKDGSIENVKIIRGIGAGLDQEALRVVNMMPRWKPGKHNGKPVSVYFTLPIKFQLLK